MNLTYYDDEVYILVVEEVFGASETDEQIPKKPPVPPVEVFSTMVCNVLEWLVSKTLIKSGELSHVGVEKRS